MLPTREQAEELLREAEKCNPGPWGNHSRTCAHCAEKIAAACGDLDFEERTGRNIYDVVEKDTFLVGK